MRGAVIIERDKATTLGSVITYQCNDNFALYEDGRLLNNSRNFNKTCEVNRDNVTGIWTGNYTCVGT